jgi:hypothetical protein
MPRFGSFLLAGEQRDKITLTYRSTPAYNPIYGHFLRLSSVSLCSWANFIIRFPKQNILLRHEDLHVTVGFAQPHGHMYSTFKPHHPILNGRIVGKQEVIRFLSQTKEQRLQCTHESRNHRHAWPSVIPR